MMLLMLAASCGASAQWECPSRLAGALKPIGDTDFMWGAEVTTSAGWRKDNYAGNLMGFVGLNYTSGKNSFYVEGGLKSWLRGSDKQYSYTNYDTEAVTYKDDRTGKVVPGLREAFYRYSGERNTLTLGLQSAKSDDPYLLNERIVGANYLFRAGKLKINAIGGSVMQEFARNGRFCTLGYLYNDIVVGRPRLLMSNSFGKTNFAMLTAAFLPEKQVDEFGSGNASVFSFDKLGLVAYGEFGSLLPHPTALGGLYSEMSVAGVTLKPEVLLQTSKGNNALLYNLTAEKTFTWSPKQTTRLFAQYFGYAAIDDGARAVNSFSNLFLGDVLRQDVLDGPLVSAGVKHSFTPLRLSVKLQGTMQTKASSMGGDWGFIRDDVGSELKRMKELDLSVSKNFGQHWWLSATAGLLGYPDLVSTDYVLSYKQVHTTFGKLECRFTF
jgi:hypothetical protein